MRKINHIYCDFDGVIVNTIKAIVQLYNEDFKYYKKFTPVNWTDVNTWNFEECNCAKESYINTYFNTPRFFNTLEYMYWANEALCALHYKNNYDITIVSSGFRPNLHGKDDWIKKNLPFCDFVGVNLKKHEDKSHVDMSAGLFIDDSFHNLATSNAKYKVCFGELYPWNEEWTGDRCMNWMDIRNYIEKIENE